MKESGIEINTDNYTSFRISKDCKAYNKLSGLGASIKINGEKIALGFKEMDIAICSNNILHLIELTDFSDIKKTEDSVNKQILEIFKKSLDTFILLMSLKCKTEYSKGIAECFNEECLKICCDKLNFIFIVNNFSYLKVEYKNLLKKQVNSLMTAYFKIYDYDLSIYIFDYKFAKQELDFVI